MENDLNDNSNSHKLGNLRKQMIQERLKGSRFLLPNLVTVGHMFCGFLAIVYSTSNRYEKAVVAIALAMLLDGLDGRVARRFNATSDFGVEFDSLSDLVSFGVAPAILVYNWCFKALADEFGVAICFIYVVAIATRLARFNISVISLKSFTGLPSPAGAGMVIAIVNAFIELDFGSAHIGFISLLMILISLLTVSRFNFFSIKQVKLSQLGSGVPLIAAPLIVVLWYNNKIGILILVSTYVLSGPFSWLYSKRADSRKE
jgi:CDP-diacylglycerol---serine O-phosphatidyltransferase